MKTTMLAAIQIRIVKSSEIVVLVKVASNFNKETIDLLLPSKSLKNFGLGGSLIVKLIVIAASREQAAMIPKLI